MTLDLQELRIHYQGLLLGCAVGDALGLPAEGLSPERIKRLWGSEWRHRFIFGRGMISDDTEHTIFVAQSILAHPNDSQRFQHALANKLRLWLLGLPAGIGLATLRAILKLWMGFPPHRSGVWSAGNGPAMRSAIIGACYATQRELRKLYLQACTRITHIDPRAEIAATAVAEAAAWIINQSGRPGGFIQSLRRYSADAAWEKLLLTMADSLAREEDTVEFAKRLGLGRGVSGYAYHSVPVALHAWLRHPGDFRRALESALDCGGDTDTVGAITGALAGASVGEEGIPKPWLEGLADWPRSRGLLLQLGDRLAQQKLNGDPQEPVNYFWPGLLLRNLLFLVMVLLHGFRRLLPPY